MQALQTQFGGMSLAAAGPRRATPFVSNGTGAKLAMKSRMTFQVEVVVGGDEPQDAALKRFRREVMAAGLIPEVRRRRRFENTVELKKRKFRECRMKNKAKGPIKTFGSVATQEPAPFSDMFGTADDILLNDILVAAEAQS